MTTTDAGRGAQDYKGAAAEFLLRDYSEVFSEKRRYEDAAWDVCKFAFLMHSTLIAASLGAYQISFEKALNLIPVACALLGIGAVIGTFFLFLLVRNRVYFVVATRYINAQRAHFLAKRPLGFENPTGFFVAVNEPPYFSWRSTQTWASYVVAALNALVLSAFMLLLFARFDWNGAVAVISFVLTWSLQAVLVRAYLSSLEDSATASVAVFGTPSVAEPPH